MLVGVSAGQGSTAKVRSRVGTVLRKRAECAARAMARSAFSATFPRRGGGALAAAETGSYLIQISEEGAMHAEKTAIEPVERAPGRVPGKSGPPVPMEATSAAVPAEWPASWEAPEKLDTLEDVREAARGYLKCTREWIAYAERNGREDQYREGKLSVLRWLLGALGDRYRGDPPERYEGRTLTEGTSTPSQE